LNCPHERGWRRGGPLRRRPSVRDSCRSGERPCSALRHFCVSERVPSGRPAAPSRRRPLARSRRAPAAEIVVLDANQHQRSLRHDHTPLEQTGIIALGLTGATGGPSARAGVRRVDLGVAPLLDRGRASAPTAIPLSRSHRLPETVVRSTRRRTRASPRSRGDREVRGKSVVSMKAQGLRSKNPRHFRAGSRARALALRWSGWMASCMSRGRRCCYGCLRGRHRS
jgi:hypothetical protein